MTDSCPVATRDRHDFPRLVNQRVPGVPTVVDDIVEGFEDGKLAFPPESSNLMYGMY
jgi:hypothetical protein